MLEFKNLEMNMKFYTFNDNDVRVDSHSLTGIMIIDKQLYATDEKFKSYDASGIESECLEVCYMNKWKLNEIYLTEEAAFESGKAAMLKVIEKEEAKVQKLREKYKL